MKSNNSRDRENLDKKKPEETSDGVPQKLSEWPVDGYFGQFGGQHVQEALLKPLQQLEEAFLTYREDDNFQRDLRVILADYAGRPTSLFLARRLSKSVGGARIYLKREDLLHGGGHLINNALGQALLAKRMGKKRLILDTASGDHGIAVASAAAVFDLEAHIYIGQNDWEHQHLKVDRMRMMGAKIHPVQSRRDSLEDAIAEAWKDWTAHHDVSHYLVGSAVGPHPYPYIVREFQRVIGDEIKGQILRKERRLPDLIVAPLGGGSCAIGTFYPFIDEEFVQFAAVEAGGQSGESKIRSRNGQIAIYHGMKSYVLQNEGGAIWNKKSIASGLAYPALGPEHAFYADRSRIETISVTDRQALDGIRGLIETEGILASLESAHAVYLAIEKAKQLGSDGLLVVTLAGRGDKDFDVIQRHLSQANHAQRPKKRQQTTRTEQKMRPDARFERPEHQSRSDFQQRSRPQQTAQGDQKHQRPDQPSAQPRTESDRGAHQSHQAPDSETTETPQQSQMQQKPQVPQRQDFSRQPQTHRPPEGPQTDRESKQGNSDEQHKLRPEQQEGSQQDSSEFQKDQSDQQTSESIQTNQDQ